jgi:hypothetical protein
MAMNTGTFVFMLTVLAGSIGLALSFAFACGLAFGQRLGFRRALALDSTVKTRPRG